MMSLLIVGRRYPTPDNGTLESPTCDSRQFVRHIEVVTYADGHMPFGPHLDLLEDQRLTLARLVLNLEDAACELHPYSLVLGTNGATSQASLQARLDSRGGNT